MRKNVVMIAAVISLMVSLQATAEGTEDFPKTAVMTDGSTAGKRYTSAEGRLAAEL